MNVSITGPKVIFEIFGIQITETVVNMWIVMAVVTAVCIWLGSGLKVKPTSKKQIVAEKLVSMIYDLVETTMGKHCMAYAPYIGTLFTMSICGSLLGLFGLRPYTADLSVTVAWALITFMLIQGNSIRYNGVGGWLKGFLEPVPFLLPINIVGEIATPISISFRHFGNIAAGVVISALLYGALSALSTVVLKVIPNAFISSIPIFQLGLPAILSIYFDVFTSFLQAYIICMLTMVYVTNAIPAPQKDNN